MYTMNAMYLLMCVDKHMCVCMYFIHMQCMLVYIHMCEHKYICMCECLWKPEDVFMPSLPYFFKTEFLTEPGAHKLG